MRRLWDILLEDEAIKALPKLLERDYGITLEERLRREYIKDASGKYIGPNIIGKGKKDGKEITVIGEGKVRLSKKDVRGFIERRVKRLAPLYGKIFPLLVTHMTSEYDVEDFAKKKSIALYYSYDF